MIYVLYMTSPNSVDPMSVRADAANSSLRLRHRRTLPRTRLEGSPRNLQPGRGDLVDDLPAFAWQESAVSGCAVSSAARRCLAGAALCPQAHPRAADLHSDGRLLPG